LATLAREYDRMLERLDESFNRLSQFTADAAHEFRTPLNNEGCSESGSIEPVRLHPLVEQARLGPGTSALCE
jgi:two-component system heavy metal sensor histidine kinase CusS